ncbi:MAG: hypothetical protein FWC00_04555 [Firmicutes bacterium]|nr:hypothetical protein [Bacillota bacterium]
MKAKDFVLLALGVLAVTNGAQLINRNLRIADLEQNTVVKAGKLETKAATIEDLQQQLEQQMAQSEQEKAGLRQEGADLRGNLQGANQGLRLAKAQLDAVVFQRDAVTELLLVKLREFAFRSGYRFSDIETELESLRLALQGHVDSLGAEKERMPDLYEEIGPRLFSHSHAEFASEMLNAFSNTREIERVFRVAGNNRERHAGREIRALLREDTQSADMTAERIGRNFRAVSFNEALRRMDPQEKRANMLRKQTPVRELDF